VHSPRTIPPHAKAQSRLCLPYRLASRTEHAIIADCRRECKRCGLQARGDGTDGRRNRALLCCVLLCAALCAAVLLCCWLCCCAAGCLLLCLVGCWLRAGCVLAACCCVLLCAASACDFQWKTRMWDFTRRYYGGNMQSARTSCSSTLWARDLRGRSELAASPLARVCASL
jgi:hypothetical protein